jgi:tetratricopeptide (TPR) repeat protein
VSPIQPIPAPAPPLAPQAPAKSSLLREAASLERAVRALRREGDPVGALRAIDDYLAAYPDGVLRADAELAQIEAWLRIGKSQEALTALDRLSLSGLPRSREFTVVRGELRAAQGRCRQAVHDFAAAVQGSDDLAERALVGRADCRAQKGDRAGARADLDDYLRRFPSGRFAARARQALER